MKRWLPITYSMVPDKTMCHTAGRGGQCDRRVSGPNANHAAAHRGNPCGPTSKASDCFERRPPDKLTLLHRTNVLISPAS